ncbi:MAG: hypothetical protein IPJ34_33455 [Myxococcales bacterium]|nr:hypothetical protein [Myxococcales bacterium]
MKLWYVLFVVLSACSRKGDEIGSVKESKDAAPPASLPIVRTILDIEAADRKRAVVYGLYSVEPIQPHQKGGRRTSIVLSDGVFLHRGFGVIPSELGFVNKLVKVTGVVMKTAPDPHVQTVGGPRVQVETIELAPGETAVTPAPTVVPAPPMLTTLPPLSTQEGRWVAVNATVDSVLVTTSPWGAAILKLSDGGLIDVDGVLESEWKPLVGTSITVIARVFKDSGAAGRLSLHGAGPPCAGAVPRCGLDDP